MRAGAFARSHPAVSFSYFAVVIVLSVVLLHPAYLVLSALGGGACWLCLRGRQALPTFGFLAGAFVLVAGLNPLFNTLGATPLFFLLGRPYTWEALCYGMALGAMFAAVSLWFLCYGAVISADRFTSLFGRLIPSVSLLLVMVLRLVPGYRRRARQITAARRSIGMAASGSLSRRLRGALTVLAALCGWALEGAVVTADSMRARGYGTAPRTSFQLYHFTGRDAALAVLAAALTGLSIAGAAGGRAAVQFIPALAVAVPSPWGLGAYALLMLLPTLLHLREELLWHILRSGI